LDASDLVSYPLKGLSDPYKTSTSNVPKSTSTVSSNEKKDSSDVQVVDVINLEKGVEKDLPSRTTTKKELRARPKMSYNYSESESSDAEDSNYTESFMEDFPKFKSERDYMKSILDEFAPDTFLCPNYSLRRVRGGIRISSNDSPIRASNSTSHTATNRSKSSSDCPSFDQLRKLNSNDVVGTIPALNITLTVKDVRTLIPPNWLCDEVINAYIWSVSTCDDQIYFVPSYWSAVLSSRGNEVITSWKNSRFLSEELENAQKTIVIPVNINECHWVLCVVLPKEKRWAILDSAGHRRSIEQSSFVHNFQAFLLSHKVGTTTEFTLEIPIREENPHQHMEVDAVDTDGSNCGVYVCYYVVQLQQGKSLKQIAANPQTKAQITAFRYQILDFMANNIPLKFDNISSI